MVSSLLIRLVMTPSNRFRGRAVGLSPLVLLASSTWACNPPDEAVQVQVAVEEPAPSASYSVGLDSDLPLGFDDVVEVRPGLMVGLESQTSSIWGLTVQGEQILTARLDNLLPGTGRVIALVREPAGIRIVTGTGSTILLDSVQLVPVEEEAIRFDLEPAPVQSIQAAPGGGYFVLTKVLDPNRGGSREWLPVLQRMGSTGTPEEVLWRGKGVSARDRSGMFDQVAFAFWADTIFIGRSGPPPQLLLLTLEGDTIHLGPLDPPSRPVTKQTRDAFAKALRSVPRSARVGVSLPDQYPTLVRISIHQGMLLTVPITGDIGVESYGLDLYCREAFERTLLNAPELTGVFILDSAVLAVRTRPDQTARVDYIPLDRFSLGCTHD